MTQTNSAVPVEKKPEAREYSVARLFEKTFPDNAWWLPTWIPKSSVCLMGGPTKIGKSWLNNNLCRSLVLGAEFLPPEPGYTGIRLASASGQNVWSQLVPAAPCRVLLVDKELGERTLHDRLKAIFGEDFRQDPQGTLDALEDRFFYRTRPTKGETPISLSDPDGLAALKEICFIVAPNVIILDPMNMLHSYSENDNTEIQRLINTMHRLQESLVGLETSIVMSHHFQKPPRERSSNFDPLDLNNFRGASKYTDAADAIITLDRVLTQNPNPLQWELQGKVEGRHGPGSPKFQLGVNTQRDGRIYFRKVLD